MELALLKDRDLLKEIIDQNNQRAFKVFFDRYYSRLINFSIYFVKSHENAEDVVEEVFLKFLKMGKDILTIESVKSYLYRMTRNISIDYVSSHKKNRHITLMENIEDYQFPEESSPSSLIESNEFENYVNKIVESFPPKRKVIFSLSRDELLSYAEISSLLKISQKTVESHMRIALKTLRTAITDYDASLQTTTRKFNFKNSL
ncbi:MAG: RNA polymerase sigma-70 factor [Cytophagales bacterium]|nr:RNA polymerase sigma-70 factor [Cytophagales bacterium]